MVRRWKCATSKVCSWSNSAAKPPGPGNRRIRSWNSRGGWESPGCFACQPDSLGRSSFTRLDDQKVCVEQQCRLNEKIFSHEKTNHSRAVARLVVRRVQ